MLIQLCLIHTVRKQHEASKKHFLHSDTSPGSNGIVSSMVRYVGSSCTFCGLQFSKFLY